MEANNVNESSIVWDTCRVANRNEAALKSLQTHDSLNKSNNEDRNRVDTF